MAAPRRDLTGQKFGRLTAINIAGHDKGGRLLWLFQCDCGNKVVRRGTSVSCGDQKSCGCLGKEMLNEHNKPTHGGTNTRLYSIWRAMKKRCYQPSTYGYQNYGGRGITVCKEWRDDFTAFRDWAISHGYNDDLTLDRINCNGDYEPDNCRFATWVIQENNKRKLKSKPEAQTRLTSEIARLKAAGREV